MCSSIRQGESFEKEGREACEALKNWGIERLSGILRVSTPAGEDIVVTREQVICLRCISRAPRSPPRPWPPSVSFRHVTQPCVRDHSSSTNYKNPWETSLGPHPCSLLTLAFNPLEMVYTFRVSARGAIGVPDRSCHQQPSFVLVNKANCGNCNCDDRYVVRC